jgi:hypothetical protein
VSAVAEVSEPGGFDRSVATLLGEQAFYNKKPDTQPGFVPSKIGTYPVFEEIVLMI